MVYVSEDAWGTEAWNKALGRVIHGKRVTEKHVLACVAMIAAVSGDAEVAHSREDSLLESVLEAIAQGRCADPARCAAAAITSGTIDFARWCA